MKRFVSWVVIATLTFNPPGLPCFANPTGGTVVGGDRNGTISGSGTGVTTINQNGNRIIINWQNFSIGSGEITRFIQPSANSWALNRVISGNPSLIYGSLQANGHVVVLNQNGILVSAQGRIDTKGFFASTLDLKDSSFMRGGRLTLSGDSTASVRNEGTINALGGDVFLIANTVENSGTISAPQGTVGLAAGSSVRLVPAGNERISVLAGNANGAAANGVHNSGTIEGASAELKAAGGNIYALAINNEGVVRANSVVNEGGHIYLRASGGNIENSGTLSAHNADGSGGEVIMDGGHYTDFPSTVVNSGTIDARGEAAGTKGGTVQMVGDHVGLFDHAVIDVSGHSGGGTALIGGDTQGGNPNIQNAQRTYVSPDAIVRADSLSLGNGGKVVVWSDDITRYFGSISAQGGAQGGRGGFAEVSGHSLNYNGTVNLLGARGTAGTLLLDPKNITIQTGGADPLAGNTQFGDNDNGSVTFDPGAIVLALNSANVKLQANNDIMVLNAIDASANSGNFGLTLQAGRTISVQADITLRGSFTATANDPGATNNRRDNGAGVFTMASGTLIDTHLQNGNIQISVSTGPGAGHVSGDITVDNLNAGSGNVLIANGGATDGSSILAASATSLITANSVALDVNNAANNNGAIGATLTPIQVSTAALNARSLNGNIFINSPNQGISIGGASLGGLTGIQGGGNLTLSAKGTIGQTEAISLAGNSSFTLNQSGADVILANAGNQLGNVTVAGADHDVNLRNLSAGASVTFPTTLNNLTLQFDNSTISLPALTLAALNVSAGGNVNFNGDITATSVSAHSGTDGSGNITFAAGGVTINADSQTYQAGKLDGSASTAQVLFHPTTDPIFHGTTAGTTPTTFTYEQDHSIAGTDLPDAVGQLGASATTGPASYTIRSDGGSVELAAMTLPGTLQVTAHGAITQTGALDVHSGASTFTVTAAGSDVLLGLANHFGSQTVTIAGSVRDINFHNVDSSAIVPVMPGSFRNLTLTLENAPITLSALNLSGNLNLTAGGLISDNGDIVVSGTTTLAAGAANDIKLDNNDNFVGAVTITSGNNVTLNDINGLTVAGTVSGDLFTTAGGTTTFGTVANTLHVTGNLNASGNGLISDANDLTVNGTTTLAAGSANNITLNRNDDFAGAVTITSGNTVTLNDINALTVDGTVSGNLITTAGSTTTFGTLANTLHVTGNLNASGNGLISDANDLTVNGTTTLAAGLANNITLDNNDDFGGAVTITSGNTVTLNDINGLTVAGTVSGDLFTTAGGTTTFGTVANALHVTGNLNASGNGLISDANAVTVNGTTILAAGAANDITLDNNDDFAGAVTITSGNTVTLNDINALTVDGTVSGNLITTAGSTTTFGTVANTLHVIGNLNASGNGLISDANDLTVNGTTTLAAGLANDITLNNNDDFGGGVTITSGHTVTLNDINALTVGGNLGGNLLTTSGGDTVFNTLNVGGGITADAHGNITGNGVVTANGAGSTFTIDGVTGDVTLGQGNRFGSQLVTINSANGGAVRDVTLHNVDSGAVAPSLPSTGLRNLTLEYDAAGIQLSGLTLSGNLTVTAGGDITQSGAILMGGAGQTATFTAGSHDVVLGNNANDFNTVAINSGNDVTLVDANRIDLGASTVSGNLNVTALNGPITQTGALLVNGAGKTATFTAAGIGNDINLFDSGNDFTTIALSGGTAHIQDANGLDFGASTLSGNLFVTAHGAISQSGALTFSTPGAIASFDAGASHDINLGNPGNDFSTVAIVSGNNVTLRDANALDIGASTISGNFNVTANGLISQSGAISAHGAGKTATFAAGAGNDIFLIDPGNDFSTVAIVSGRDVKLQDANAIDLGASTVSASLSVTARGDITESGALNVTSGQSTFTIDSVTGDILLGNQANDFGSQTVTFNASNGGSVRDAALRNINALAAFPTLPGGGMRNVFLQFDAAPITIASALVASGQINLIAGGPVTEVTGGTITAAELSVRTTSTTPGEGDVTLNNVNHVGTLAVDAEGAVAFKDAGGTVLHVDTVTESVGAHEVVGISSHGHDITLNADDFNIAEDIDASVNANKTKGGGTVRLVPVSSNEPIHFGDTPQDTGTAMNFSQAELDRIWAHELFVGSVNAGDASGTHNTGIPGDDGKDHFDIPFDNDHVITSGRRNDVAVVANQLSSLLAGAILPVPRLEVTSFSGTGIDTSDAEKMLEPDAIGVLFLQVPFLPVEEKKYKVEEISKWTAGRIAAGGTTAGPQSAR